MQKDKARLFGEILANGNNNLSEAGKIAEKYWLEIPKHYPNVILDMYVIMPNHVHGIIIIADAKPKDYQVNSFQKIIPSSIGSIIRGYKIGVTKWFRANSNIHQPWQRNFYETIIRDDGHFVNVQNYILNNVINWEMDDLNKG